MAVRQAAAVAVRWRYRAALARAATARVKVDDSSALTRAARMWLSVGLKPPEVITTIAGETVTTLAGDATTTI